VGKKKVKISSSFFLTTKTEKIKVPSDVGSDLFSHAMFRSVPTLLGLDPFTHAMP